MAHIDTLQAGIYSSLAYLPTNYALSAVDTAAEQIALFAATEPTRISNIREFPEFSTKPANVVNVPVFGQATSAQVNAQADQSTFELTINYIPADHAALAALAGNGSLYVFQIALCDKNPTSLKQIATTGIASGSTKNTVFNFAAQIVSFTVVPSLSDSLTAKISLALATEVFGPATYN